jgi:hypothetical protein
MYMTRLTNMLKWKGLRGTISTMLSSLACRSYPSYVAYISNLFSQVTPVMCMLEGILCCHASSLVPVKNW